MKSCVHFSVNIFISSGDAFGLESCILVSGIHGFVSFHFEVFAANNLLKSADHSENIRKIDLHSVRLLNMSFHLC
jgi:hypothetical protein